MRYERLTKAFDSKYPVHIERDVALIATKIAVWRYSNPGQVAIISTSLNKGGVITPKFIQAMDLLRALVEDAALYDQKVRHGGENDFDHLNIDIDDSKATLDKGFAGPYKIISPNRIEKVFLSMDFEGSKAAGFNFCKSNGGSLCNVDKIYGTDVKAPYVELDEEFYVLLEPYPELVLTTGAALEAEDITDFSLLSHYKIRVAALEKSMS
jgi:hypothetical protein